MKEVLITLLQALILIAVPLISSFAVSLLKTIAERVKATTNSELAYKYISEAADAVSTAVLYVSQTYTDKLKESSAFTKENQTEALQLAIDKAKTLITQESASFITEAYGGLNDYLRTKIEAEVKLQK